MRDFEDIILLSIVMLLQSMQSKLVCCSNPLDDEQIPAAVPAYSGNDSGESS